MNPDPRWQTALFDLDGTLCNTIELIVASFQHTHREVLGLELAREEALGWIGRTLMDIYAPWGERQQSLVDCYLQFNLANLERLQTRYDGIAELLDSLRAAGVCVGVATSKRRHSAERSLAAAGLTDLAPLVAAMDDTQQHKPHPAPIRYALERMGAAPQTSVYIGDAVVDVQAAKAAGVAQIAVTWGAGDRTDLMLEEPTAVTDSVDELARWLLG